MPNNWVHGKPLRSTACALASPIIAQAAPLRVSRDPGVSHGKQPMKHFNTYLVILLFSIVSGCAALKMDIRDSRHTRELPVKAQELAFIAESTIKNSPYNLSITNINNGTIVTNWEGYPGSEHGIWLWRKRYEGNARYIIQISPNFANPEGVSNIEVSWEARERPNANYDWVAIDAQESAHAYLRAANILELIVEKSSGNEI